MAEEEPPGPPWPWYRKFFEYWRNRNRIGPGRVELPDCDFFIVAPRRTLRVLRPTLKSGRYYETTNERPESIVDNFFTRWSRRPHSSGNCRCSFRHSGRVSTNEERIISAEINRIRTSLCEVKDGRAIEELEQRVSVNLQKLQVSVPDMEQKEEVEKSETTPTGDVEGDEQRIKNKIVKDLEKYINVLLEEILDDTVKYVAGAENSLVKRKSQKESQERTMEKNSNEDGCFNDISFSFHADNERNPDKKDSKEALGKEGYVNEAFIGSTNDPDSLDFYLRSPVGTEVTLEQLDCIDSGINSVETIEFQPEQEPSLEQSLLRIIDEKLGRSPAPLTASWEDLSAVVTNCQQDSSQQHSGQQHSDQQHNDQQHNDQRHSGQQYSGQKPTKTPVPGLTEDSSQDEQATRSTIVESQDRRVARVIDISNDNLVESSDPRDLEETVNEASFENLRLEFKDNESSSLARRKSKTMSTRLKEKLCGNMEDRPVEKISWNEKLVSFDTRKDSAMPIELEDYRRRWPDLEDTLDPEVVTYRKNRKPTIVFLHGFGSSAEIFAHQLEYFSSLGYPCIAPDLLGHGMSSAPDRKRDYQFGKLLRDLDAVLCHYAFKPGQKCVIVAHNYGCSFATALACKYESNVHQLVLISGGGPTALAPPATESAGHCCLRAILAPFLMCGLHRDILYSARGRQHPYCGPEPQEQWPSHMKHVLEGMVWPEGDYVFHRRICTPTLLVHGLRDNKVSLVQECQMERTMLKAFLEAIPAAGHTPMTDCPEQLNHMIHCFIDLWKNKKW